MPTFKLELTADQVEMTANYLRNCSPDSLLPFLESKSDEELIELALKQKATHNNIVLCLAIHFPRNVQDLIQ